MEKGSYVFCLLFVIQTLLSHSYGYSECYTPYELEGECVNINRCPSLLMLYETRWHNRSAAQFIHDSKCGTDGYDLKICCALDNESSGGLTQPTPPPTTTERTDYPPRLPRNCGRSNSTHTRVVGGAPAELGVWPWMAALGYRDLRVSEKSDYQWLCGGSLISESYVITAAHCLNRDRHRKLVVVRLGDLDLNPDVQDFAAPINMPVFRDIIHNRYNAQKYINDIALLKLDRPVTFTELIQPICLPISKKHRSNSFTNMVPFIAGWGTTSYRGPTSTALIEIQVPVWDNVSCKQSFANETNVEIDDRVLCAGIAAGGKDACQGDSGGPLMWQSGDQYYLIGVVSYGYKCGEAGHPGVYTRVTYFVDWIVDKINSN